MYGGFVSYDDTPRRGNDRKVVIGESPEKFKKYIGKLIKISNEQKKDFLFLTAWNEWGEEAYLEPDEENKYNYLIALAEALQEQDEYINKNNSGMQKQVYFFANKNTFAKCWKKVFD